MAKINTIELLEQINQIKPEVESDPELNEIVDRLIQNIKKDESLPEISVKFDNNMSMYLLTHSFKAPDSMIKLQEQLKKYAEQYHGGISLSTSFSIFK